jgi:hypothetical protein
VEVAVNTAGAEDSAFITSNGSAFYFFFTPDMSIPVEKQSGHSDRGIQRKAVEIADITSAEVLHRNGGIRMEIFRYAKLI